MFTILIFGLLAIVLIGAFVSKFRRRNDWPDDQ